MNCPKIKNKPYPLYKNIILENNKIIKVRVCQDCGYLEICHGPYKGSNWRHIFIHPDI